MKTVEVNFRVLKIEDTRKCNSILKVNATYKGILNKNTNAVYWEDSGSNQDWVFWVGDTCVIINEVGQCTQ